MWDLCIALVFKTTPFWSIHTVKWHVRLMSDSVAPDQQSVVKERVASILWSNQGFDLVHIFVVNFLHLFGSVILHTFQCISAAATRGLKPTSDTTRNSDYHLCD